MKGIELLPLIKATSKADRYSENLMKWVRKHRNAPLIAVYSPVSYVDGSDLGRFDAAKTCAGSLYIGFGGLDDGWLHGARLSEILCNGVKASEWAYPPKHRFQPLPDWWKRYIEGGKCCIDPEHWLYTDRERWEVAEDGKTRRCLWCGKHKQYLKTEMTPKTSWHPVADSI